MTNKILCKLTWIKLEKPHSQTFIPIIKSLRLFLFTSPLFSLFSLSLFLCLNLITEFNVLDWMLECFELKVAHIFLCASAPIDYDDFDWSVRGGKETMWQMCTLIGYNFESLHFILFNKLSSGSCEVKCQVLFSLHITLHTKIQPELIILLMPSSWNATLMAYQNKIHSVWFWNKKKFEIKRRPILMLILFVVVVVIVVVSW